MSINSRPDSSRNDWTKSADKSAAPARPHNHHHPFSRSGEWQTACREVVGTGWPTGRLPLRSGGSEPLPIGWERFGWAARTRQQLRRRGQGVIQRGHQGQLPTGLEATLRQAGGKPGGTEESPNSRVGNRQRFPSWIVGVGRVSPRARRSLGEATGASHVPNLRRSMAEARPLCFSSGSWAFSGGTRQAADPRAAPIGGASIPRGL